MTRVMWLSAMLVMSGCVPAGTGGGRRGELGESCTRARDCSTGLLCVGQVCVDGDGGAT